MSGLRDKGEVLHEDLLVQVEERGEHRPAPAGGRADGRGLNRVIARREPTGPGRTEASEGGNGRLVAAAGRLEGEANAAATLHYWLLQRQMACGRCRNVQGQETTPATVLKHPFPPLQPTSLNGAALEDEGRASSSTDRWGTHMTKPPRARGSRLPPTAPACCCSRTSGVPTSARLNLCMQANARNAALHGCCPIPDASEVLASAVALRELLPR